MSNDDSAVVTPDQSLKDFFVKHREATESKGLMIYKMCEKNPHKRDGSMLLHY